jgi:hypothetical protein
MRKVSVEQTMQELEKRKPPKTNRAGVIPGKSIFDISNSKEYVKAPPKWDTPKTLDDL